MTSTVETAPSPAVPASSRSRYALREAMMAEREAYESMRELVPDLALPKQCRSPLSDRQQAAVDRYRELSDQVEALRNARRSPMTGVRDDQSV